ncbi:hypothetical protein CEXT_114781 [Caerostris extrusa]|uniref:Uncharacterized protein n=1 Tax=Caerostris extrusa TaxID=172846 RepID=A0AAV4X7T5_CAEEX|nr:hypothetical protein CEXT_114781 [Caerostris extrusa]
MHFKVAPNIIWVRSRCPISSDDFSNNACSLLMNTKKRIVAYSHTSSSLYLLPLSGSKVDLQEEGAALICCPSLTANGLIIKEEAAKSCSVVIVVLYTFRCLSHQSSRIVTGIPPLSSHLPMSRVQKKRVTHCSSSQASFTKEGALPLWRLMIEWLGKLSGG